MLWLILGIPLLFASGVTSSPSSVSSSSPASSGGKAAVKRMSLDLRNYSGTDLEWSPPESNNLLQAALDVTEVKEDPPVIITSSGSDLTAVRSSTSATTSSVGVIQVAEDMTVATGVPVLTSVSAAGVSKIAEIHVLGKTNETLLIGWKKPVTDEGSFISQYQMELRDSRGNTISQQAMEMDPSGKIRNNYMYIFVSLNPASEYSFQIRPCSVSGCAEWTQGTGMTQDGWSDPPQDVRVACYEEGSGVWLSARWDLPHDARGTITGYNITLSGHSKYRNEENKSVLDHFKEWYEVKGNRTLEFKGHIRANTNYTVRVCAINKSGCGSLSHITTNSMCESPPQLPEASLDISSFSLLSPHDKSCRKLKATIQKVSERNGLIKCYKLIIVRLPVGDGYTLPKNPSLLNITSYWDVHPDLMNPDNTQETPADGVFGAYIADELPSENFVPEMMVTIGDSDFTSCYLEGEEIRVTRRQKPHPASSPSPYLLSYDTHPSRTQNSPHAPSSSSSSSSTSSSSSSSSSSTSSSLSPSLSTNASSIINTSHHNSVPDASHFILSENNDIPSQRNKYRPSTPPSYRRGPYDGILAPATNYTGFVQIQVMGPNGRILTKESHYFPPVMTGSLEDSSSSLSIETPFAPILASMSESANAIAFGVVSGLALVFLLLVFVLCFLTRKVSEVTSETDPEESPVESEENVGFSSSSFEKANPRNTNGHIARSDSENFSDKWICQPVCIQDLPPITYNLDGNDVPDSDLVFPLESVPEEFTGDDDPHHHIGVPLDNHRHLQQQHLIPATTMTTPTIINAPMTTTTFLQTLESPEVLDETRYADVHL